MSIHWKLKSHLACRYQVYTVTEFQKHVVKKTGVRISIANLCKYVNRIPKVIRLETVEILCTALDCNLSDFLTVLPNKKLDPEKKRKLSYKNTPRSKIATKTFPEPGDYEES